MYAASTHSTCPADTQKHEQAIKQFMQQQNECEMVKKVISVRDLCTLRTITHQELDLLEDDNDVFKLVGPVLVKQDRMEAQSNVEKRLSFISNELSRAEGALQTVEEKKSKKESEVCTHAQYPLPHTSCVYTPHVFTHTSSYRLSACSKTCSACKDSLQHNGARL